ncbi:helix-turn-helix transcriptional regulator [Mesorhizobium sp. M7A.F.Ca.US.010.02.1.1]|uniref:helix-turn-helix domain-containing protein n=1 Tax=Mesorhizobium sp. M7A.F.Ca.US.010.02.1.1 TaxID=2496743 RepID=UPI000FD2B746|nr:helix-turn-helix transcriptional regulator [Mesorhizobium sp. M7A.F.Ca.US.010.02.1.1]RUW89167.1 XRE family transcriptional regulator [Mesorhizobium sp. M7A.F.Ca.US.010.02.1.1]
MNVRKIIGWNLRKLRAEQGLSQERLALAAEIDRSYVGRIERGSENVTIDTLDALAIVLGVPAAALLVEPAKGERQPMPLSSGRKPKQA